VDAATIDGEEDDRRLRMRPLKPFLTSTA